MEPEAHAGLIRELGLPIYRSKVWLRILGVLSILGGVLAALTIVGIIIAWIPIWVGVLLMQAASAIERADATGEREPLIKSLEKIGLYFTITALMVLVGAAIGILVFFLMVLGLMMIPLGGF